MKVLVIGATGQTGRHVLRLLLNQNHVVTVFVRSAAKLAESKLAVRVVQADARDRVALEHAVENQDAVVCCFGPTTLGKTDVQEILMSNLTAAMTKLGVKRLVNLSAWGSGGRAVRPSSPMARYFFLPVLLRHVLADKRRGETYLFGSTLDYVNVCPGRLMNAPATGRLRASVDGQGLKQYAHREDVAAFMVGQLTESTWVRQCAAVGY